MSVLQTDAWNLGAAKGVRTLDPRRQEAPYVVLLRLVALGFPIALLTLAACDSDSTAEPIATPTPNEVVPTAARADPCYWASPVNQAQTIALSWTLPGCLRLGPESRVETLSAETYDGEMLVSTLPLTPSREQHLPAGVAPFDTDGCASNSRELRLTGRDASDAVTFRAVASCAPSSGACPEIFNPSGSPIAIGESGATCIHWTPDTTAASYRVEIRYPLVAEAYAFVAPASAVTFLLPEDAAPLLFESADRCKARKELVVEVFAQEPGKRDRRVAYSGASLECSITGD
jgi:hypothetical protein